jgi:hypothetical protein
MDLVEKAGLESFCQKDRLCRASVFHAKAFRRTRGEVHRKPTTEGGENVKQMQRALKGQDICVETKMHYSNAF